jgi:hypothetical protein
MKAYNFYTGYFMRSKEKFTPGDEVFEASKPDTIMIVEEIKEQMVVCSVVDPKTSTKRFDTYSLTALQKKQRVRR